MRTNVYVLSLALLCAFPSVAGAATQPFTVTGTTITTDQAKIVLQKFYNDANPTLADQQNLATAFNAAIGKYDANFESQVNGLLQSVNFQPVGSAFANAAAAASKGMPVDYASDFKLFTLTAGAGASVHGVSASDAQNYTFPNFLNTTTPDEGLGVNLSLLAGINLGFFDIPSLGFFDPSRLSAYINVFAYQSDKFSQYNAAADLFSFGIHGQYRLVDSVSVFPGGLLRWGGVDIATGLTYNKQTITASGQYDTSNQTQTFTYQNQQLQLNYGWSGNANVTVNTSAYSIPIEASTSLQLGYVLTLYVGGGFDFNFGSTSGGSVSDDPVTLALENSSGVTDADIIKPVGHLDFEIPSYTPYVANFRAFGGAQINIVVLALFAQANVDTADNWGANFGARAFW